MKALTALVLAATVYIATSCEPSEDIQGSMVSGITCNEPIQSGPDKAYHTRYYCDSATVDLGNKDVLVITHMLEPIDVGDSIYYPRNPHRNWKNIFHNHNYGDTIRLDYTDLEVISRAKH